MTPATVHRFRGMTITEDPHNAAGPRLRQIAALAEEGRDRIRRGAD